MDLEPTCPDEELPVEDAPPEDEPPDTCPELEAAAAEASAADPSRKRNEHFGRFVAMPLMLSIAFHFAAAAGMVWWVASRHMLPRFSHSSGVRSDSDALSGNVAAASVPAGVALAQLAAPPLQTRATMPLSEAEDDVMPNFSADRVHIAQSRPDVSTPIIGVSSAMRIAEFPSHRPGPVTRPAATLKSSGMRPTAVAISSQATKNSFGGSGAATLNPPRVVVAGGNGNNDGFDERGLPIPEYPTESKRRHEQGTVELDVEVRSDGTVGTIRILADGGHRRLGEAAVASLVRARRFEPATLGGTPVMSHLVIPYRFTLE